MFIKQVLLYAHVAALRPAWCTRAAAAQHGSARPTSSAALVSGAQVIVHGFKSYKDRAELNDISSQVNVVGALPMRVEWLSARGARGAHASARAGRANAYARAPQHRKQMRML